MLSSLLVERHPVAGFDLPLELCDRRLRGLHRSTEGRGAHRVELAFQPPGRLADLVEASRRGELRRLAERAAKRASGLERRVDSGRPFTRAKFLQARDELVEGASARRLRGDLAERRDRDRAAKLRPARNRLPLAVATGTGLVAAELLQRGFEVTGVDQSVEMLAVANQRLDGSVELVEASAESLPFPDCSFDHLTFTYLLRYVDEPGAVLSELAR